MAKTGKGSILPNFGNVQTKRAVITTAVGAAIGVGALIPVYNMVIAPVIGRTVTAVRNAGFLPRIGG